MSRRREIARRLQALQDIAGIMSAMRGLALMETHLLQGFLQSQRRMVHSLEQVAAEFLAWYPLLQPAAPAGGELCIVVGSEQGFCGDFNESLLQFLADEEAPAARDERWLVLGQRLASRCQDDARVALQLPGASVADEVPSVLLRLTRELGALVSAQGLGGSLISVLSHSDAGGGIRRRSLLPLQQPAFVPQQRFAPELTLAPPRFLASLTEHVVYAVLNEVLYSSLMAENRQRHVHMQQALGKLDEDRTRLARAYNAQRQEDITEEIEIILLSSEPVSAEGRS